MQILHNTQLDPPAGVDDLFGSYDFSRKMCKKLVFFYTVRQRLYFLQPWRRWNSVFTIIQKAENGGIRASCARHSWSRGNGKDLLSFCSDCESDILLFFLISSYLFIRPYAPRQGIKGAREGGGNPLRELRAAFLRCVKNKFLPVISF